MASWRDELRCAGLRVTAPRLAVLAEVHTHPHADVDTIITGAREGLGSLSKQAVYDVLHALTDARLLRCLQLAGSPARFEIDTGDSHHHVICRSCFAVTDVDPDGGHPPSPSSAQRVGYLIDQVEVIYWGTCPDCQAAMNTSDSKEMS